MICLNILKKMFFHHIARNAMRDGEREREREQRQHGSILYHRISTRFPHAEKVINLI